LAVVEIALPPLRERVEDIPLLAYHFLQKHAETSRSEVRRISPEALVSLQSRRWEGNVRELENAIQHAIVFCRGSTISPQDLPAGVEDPARLSHGRGRALSAHADLPYREAKELAMEEFERDYFSTLLDRTQNNVSEAARRAGLDRSNFRRAMRRFQTRSSPSEGEAGDSADGDGAETAGPVARVS